MQKEEEKQWKEELENIAAEPFARTVDDTRLEEARKAEIRADDPMAAYMAKVRRRIFMSKPLKHGRMRQEGGGLDRSAPAVLVVLVVLRCPEVAVRNHRLVIYGVARPRCSFQGPGVSRHPLSREALQNTLG